MNEDRLLRLPEVSARLALSKSAIYQMIRRGELIPVRIGGAVRFPASAVDQLIRNEHLMEDAHAESA